MDYTLITQKALAQYELNVLSMQPIAH